MAQILVILTAVLALASLAAGVGVMAFGDRTFTSRLSSRAGGGGERARAAIGLGGDLRTQAVSLLGRWGAQAGRGAIEKDKRIELRLRLVQAGFYADRAVEVYFGVRVACAAALGLAGVLAAQLAGQSGAMGVLGGLMLGANIGLFAPSILLDRRIAQRRAALHLGLPDAIDLMVVSIEAGATLTAALQRVVAEFGEFHPVLAEHFGLMLAEMQAGASRAEALTRLAARTGSEDVRSLAAMLIQSEAVGASLGDALRVFAEELRKARYMEAERRAAELPVKLSFPLVLCIFPCLVGVIFIPTAIRMLRTVAALHM